MDNVKKVSTTVWILGLLLTFLFVAVIIWFSLESAYGGDDPADIIHKMYIAGGAFVLLVVFFVFGCWAEKADKIDFENKIQAEFGLKPISKMELFSKHINRDRFYAPLEWPRGCMVPEHRFHGEYKGCKICIIDPSPPPHIYWWELRMGQWTAAVHIKSNSFHFPKFLIRNKLMRKFFVVGDQKAQMRFDKPHILNFFNKSRKLAAQGNGNEFIFHEIDGEKGNYQLLLEHAFIVLELLSKAAPFSSVSEIGKFQEECKRAHIRKLLEIPIITVITVALVYLLLYR